jgi:hypothetical protein
MEIRLACGAALLALFAQDRSARDPVAFLIDRADYRELRSLVDAYERAVERACPVRIVISEGDWSAATPEQVRDELRRLREAAKIEGAVLCGRFPYRLWRSRENNRVQDAVSSFYYQDLDAEFSDSDGDGRLDTRKQGPNAGVEIWVAWMYPPASKPDEARALLKKFLQKCLDEFSGKLRVENRLLLYQSMDNGWYYSNSALEALVPAAFKLSEVDHYGREGTVSTPEPTPLKEARVEGKPIDLSAPTYVGLWNSRTYKICEIVAHAAYDSQLYVEGQKLVRTPDIARARGGALYCSIMGCQSGAFNYNPSKALILAYPFGDSVCVAATGCAFLQSWKGHHDILYRGLAEGKYLGKAWLDRLRSGVDGGLFDNPMKEHTLAGNPFFRLRYGSGR